MGLVPDEFTPTALAKMLSWALVQERSHDRRDAIHTLVITNVWISQHMIPKMEGCFLRTQKTRPYRTLACLVLESERQGIKITGRADATV